MKSQISRGTCFLCKKTFDKKAMTRHLKSCIKEAASYAPTGKKKPREKKTFHLVIEGRYLPEYWIHVEATADTKFEDLDAFLRRIWLECCWHMSSFTIDKQRYSVSPMGELDEEDMNVKLGDVLRPRMKFFHEYDFGTTTDLALKVASERTANGGSGKVSLLARNEPPLIKCGSCGKPAEHVCVQCLYEDKGWLCNACACKHECGEDMLLPVVNSPRVGMCGYTGE